MITIIEDKIIKKVKKRLAKRIRKKIIEDYNPAYLKWANKCFICIIIIFLLYFGAHSLILYGRLKERESRNCVSVQNLSLWENSLETTQAVCIDVQNSQLDEIKNFYNEELKMAQEEVEKWKGYYLYLQKQNEETEKKED